MRSEIIMYSGGLASYEEARLCAERYGKDHITMLFADTLIEHTDLYRFLIQSAASIQQVEVADLIDTALLIPPPDSDGNIQRRKFLLPILARQTMERIPGFVWLIEGRTPWDVYDDTGFLGSFRVGHCSSSLKRDPCDDWLEHNADPATHALHFGFYFDEASRLRATRKSHGNWVVEAHISELMRVHSQIADDLTLLGIEIPTLYKQGYSHNNCYTGDMKIITSEGTFPLQDLAGRTITVLSTKANWVPATVKSFGVQPVLEVTVKRLSRTKKLRATPEHIWFKRKTARNRDGREEVITSDLRPGDFLSSMWSKRGAGVRPSMFGIAHGIVFGDGTAPRYKDPTRANWNPPANVTLCGDKDQELLQYFPGSPTTVVKDVGIKVNDLPRYFKEAPSMRESKSYLLGWLAGYFAADGSISAGDGGGRLASAKKENLELARDIATLVGIPTYGIREDMRRGLGAEDTMLYSLVFPAGAFADDCLLIEQHRTNNRPRQNQMPDWEVISVVEAGQEEVFCAVVPEHETFTLEDNIFTHNCSGFCCRAGQSHFGKLLQSDPSMYVYSEERERRWQQNTGKPHTYLHRITDGQLNPLSLETLREELVDGGQADPLDIGKCGCFIQEEEIEF